MIEILKVKVILEGHFPGIVRKKLLVESFSEHSLKDDLVRVVLFKFNPLLRLFIYKTGLPN